MTRQTSGRPRSVPPPPPPKWRTQGTEPSAEPSNWTLWFERYAHLASAALIVAGPVILLSLIAAGIVYVRLSHGPVSLKAFSSSIEQGINAELGEYRARIDDAVLALSDTRGIEIQLVNLRISEPDGDLVASAPLAAVELSHGALFMLRAVPESVLLLEPKVSFRYTEAAGLTLSISDPAQSPEGAPAAPSLVAPPVEATRPEKEAATTTQAKSPPLADAAPFHHIDLARALADASARARRSGNATSKLREIGVRNATVVIDYGGKTSQLNLAEATIDLEHRSRRSVMSGSATVGTPRGPWTLSFRTEDSEKGNFIKVTTSVRDLVPSTLAKASPQMSLLETLDMPIGGDLAVELSTAGELKGATLALDLGRGRIGLPSMSGTPLTLNSGQIKLNYDAAARRLQVAPSTLTWGESRITFEGDMVNEAATDGEQQWRYQLKSTEGVLAAEEFGIAGINIDTWRAAGRIVPGEGLVQLSEFTLKAGGAEVSINGDIITASDDQSTRVEAVMSPMTLPTLKALWPRAFAPAARTWVGKHVTDGTLRSGKFKLLSGKFLDREKGGADGKNGRLSMSIEASDLNMVPLPHGLPVVAPRALIRLEGNALEVTIPEAAIVAGPSRELPVKAGRFAVLDVDAIVPIGELAFRTQTSLANVIDTIKSSQIVAGAAPDIPADAIDGKVDGQVKFTVALVESPNAPPTTAEGKARISDIRTKQPLGRLDIQGGTIDINVAQTAVIANGELIVNGVLAKLDMQRIFDAPPDMQPPLRLSATLDNADRTQLGLDVNHLVQGDVPFEITILQGSGDKPAVHARADLSNAELTFQDLAWRKAPGRSAFLEFDVVTGASPNIDLKNFKISGDDIAIEGWMTIDGENEVSEFVFPNFSLNVVSRLEVQGNLSADKIWSIKARGSTYDGKDLFRSLLSLGQSGDDEIKPIRPSNGIDLDAAIDTVLGHSEVSMRAFKLKLSKRRDVLSGLDAQGTLDGGKPLTVLLKKDQNARIVNSESTDAGQAFKLVGFYPNIQGGRLRLELNLDAKGAADKSGLLTVEDFRVLGDPIVSEVYSSASSSGPAIETTPQGQRRVVREVFEFDRMKVPFSVGHGQFVLEESYVKGPIIGASIRGKVDYTSQRVNLGGTYVPLQGINSALCDIPLFGPIVAGLECEGVFGITYAIQGPMSQPQVIVNPLSMFTPGILRGIMEMTNPNPTVQPREEQRQKTPAEKRVRASSSSATGNDAEKKDSSRTGAIDGWSSETKPGAATKK